MIEADLSPGTRQARLDGQLARLSGVAFNNNPYPLGTSYSRAWSRGWREIDEGRVAA